MLIAARDIVMPVAAAATPWAAATGAAARDVMLIAATTSLASTTWATTTSLHVMSPAGPAISGRAVATGDWHAFLVPGIELVLRAVVAGTTGGWSAVPSTAALLHRPSAAGARTREGSAGSGTTGRRTAEPGRWTTCSGTVGTGTTPARDVVPIAARDVVLPITPLAGRC